MSEAVSAIHGILVLTHALCVLVGGIWGRSSAEPEELFIPCPYFPACDKENDPQDMDPCR